MLNLLKIFWERMWERKTKQLQFFFLHLLWSIGPPRTTHVLTINNTLAEIILREKKGSPQKADEKCVFILSSYTRRNNNNSLTVAWFSDIRRKRFANTRWQEQEMSDDGIVMAAWMKRDTNLQRQRKRKKWRDIQFRKQEVNGHLASKAFGEKFLGENIYVSVYIRKRERNSYFSFSLFFCIIMLASIIFFINVY